MMMMGAGGAGNVLVNLASSWGVSLGRRRKESMRVEATIAPVIEGDANAEEDVGTDVDSEMATSVPRGTSEARKLLKKFEAPPTK